jgi:hypothetical protein
MANYLSWLQNAMQASPWGNTDLNKKLMSYATENVSAASEFTQQLSQAKSVEDAIKIQTEFVKTQMDAFGQRAKEVGVYQSGDGCDEDAIWYVYIVATSRA